MSALFSPCRNNAPTRRSLLSALDDPGLLAVSTSMPRMTLTAWDNLNRAIDSVGETVEFLFSQHRDLTAAKRFFNKALETIASRLVWLQC